MTPPLPRSPETAALTQRAQALVDLGRPADALPLLHRALGQAPDDDTALCLLSLAHWNLGQSAEALAWAERAVAARPDGLWAHQLLACHLLNMGQYPRSLAAAQEAVRLGPENVKGLKILGRAQLSSGDVAASRETAERMRAQAPDSELTHELLTLIAVQENQWSEVARHCRDALAIQPSSYISLAYLGKALDKLTPARGLFRDPGRLPEAIECLGQATQMDPAEGMARVSLTVALGRYLLRDVIQPFCGLGLVFLALAALNVFVTGTSPLSYWFFWLAGGLLLARAGVGWRISRRRFRALPSFVQQFWRQHCAKTTSLRSPWN